MEIKPISSGSKGNCYLVSDGKTKILLDCGIPIRQIRIGCDFELSSIAGCLITHCHQDHCKSLYPLLLEGMDCYVPANELQLIEPSVRLAIETHHRAHKLKGAPFTDDQYDYIHIGTLLVAPFGVEHDTPEPVGYLVYSEHTKEKVLYFTDTYTVPVKFAGLNYIIGECNYDSSELWEHIDSGSTNTGRAKRLFRSHMSLDNFLSFLDQNDLTHLKQIYICHMSDDHGNEKKIKKAVQKKTGVEVIICQ